MFHTMIAAIALGVAGLTDGSQQLSQGQNVMDQAQDSQPQGRRFWVQFRQPFWRDHIFGSRQEMDEFVDGRGRNGWDLQVFPYEFRVRYRLVQWGGSRIFDDLAEARAWARYLQNQEGYETRIVDAP